MTNSERLVFKARKTLSGTNDYTDWIFLTLMNLITVLSETHLC